jgi:predicted branched-subunit amino acid permease
MTVVTKDSAPQVEASYVDGIRLVLPFAAADALDGLAFGAIAAGLGLGVVAPIVLSATAFSGSAQFAALTVISNHGSLLAVLVAAAALNARYLAFGASLAPALSRRRLRRALEVQFVTDMSWALAHRGGRISRHVLVGAGATSLAAWTTGTALGVLLGGAVGGYRAVGLDAALPAFFLCLAVERVRERGGAARAAGGGVAALCLAPFLPVGLPLLVVLAGALAWRRS